ncbi:MAG: hypothetical protein ABIH20_05510 [Candidatus Diapherotrites archaeon]
MVEEKLIKVCPRCGSGDFYYRSSRVAAIFPTCRDCGFTDHFIEVPKEVQQEIQDKYAAGEITVKPRFEATALFPTRNEIFYPTLAKIGLIVLAIAFALMILGMLGIIDLSTPI